MSGLRSRNKGKRGERELCEFLRDLGLSARRSQQYAGNVDASDVLCEELKDWHVEVKRTESVNFYKAFSQALKDSQGKKLPIVFHRKNRGDWMVFLSAHTFIKTCLIYDLTKEIVKNQIEFEKFIFTEAEKVVGEP